MKPIFRKPLIKVLLLSWGVSAHALTIDDLKTRCTNAMEAVEEANISTWGLVAIKAQSNNIQFVNSNNNYFFYIITASSSAITYRGNFAGDGNGLLNHKNADTVRIALSANKGQTSNTMSDWINDEEIKGIVACGAHYNNPNERGVHWVHAINNRSGGFIALAYGDNNYQIISDLN